MDFVSLAVRESPTAAKVFMAVCGIAFMGFGGVFLSKAQKISQFMGGKVSSMSTPSPPGYPSMIHIRRFGVAFLIVGALLVAFSLLLFMTD
ncbi:hypothetical protein ACWCQE_25595 [Streptomyces sp. NPDC002409]